MSPNQIYTPVSAGLIDSTPLPANATASSFDKLMEAYKEGVVSTDQIMDIFMVKPGQREAAVKGNRSRIKDLESIEINRPLMEAEERRKLLSQAEIGPLQDAAARRAAETARLDSEEKERNRATSQQIARDKQAVESRDAGRAANDEFKNNEASVAAWRTNFQGIDLPTKAGPDGKLQIDFLKVNEGNTAEIERKKRLEATKLRLDRIKPQTITEVDPATGNKTTRIVQMDVDGTEVSSSPKTLTDLANSPVADAKEIQGYNQDFKKDKTIADINAVRVTHNQITGLISKGSASGPKDIALIFTFMKSLDPQSTIQKGEYASAAEAAGIFDRALNYANQLKQGTKLGPEQRQEFLDAVQIIKDARERDAAPTIRQYYALAIDRKFDPLKVLTSTDLESMNTSNALDAAEAAKKKEETEQPSAPAGLDMTLTDAEAQAGATVMRDRKNGTFAVVQGGKVLRILGTGPTAAQIQVSPEVSKKFSEVLNTPSF